MKEHKYAEILRAIADGKQIQGANGEANEPEHFTWKDVTHASALTGISLGEKYEPLFYRVKPEKVYPVTSYTGEELDNMWMKAPSSHNDALVYIANAVLKRYIDEQGE